MYEIRTGKPVDVREESGTVKVSGYAAVFNEEANIAGLFREVIKPGAFRSAIGRDDVVFLVNHEGLPLARTRSGTLMLKEDERGLYMESELDVSDPDVQKIIPKMKRGDLDKMSFAFIADKREWDESDDTLLPLRTVTEATLFDVSIVNSPAYSGTEIGLRCLNNYREQKTYNHAAVTLRMKMNLTLRQMTGRPAR